MVMYKYNCYYYKWVKLFQAEFSILMLQASFDMGWYEYARETELAYI